MTALGQYNAQQLGKKKKNDPVASEIGFASTMLAFHCTSMRNMDSILRAKVW